jgi:hypothetical protein
LAWARERALADPDASVAIAVADLQSRRAEVRALAKKSFVRRCSGPVREGAARPTTFRSATRSPTCRS